MKQIFTVAALIISSPILAQVNPADSAHTLDELVVTANKLPQKQSSTGKVVTVITREEIDRAAARTLGQLLNGQAGLTINGAGNNLGSNQSVFMRGAAAGRTLILVDGQPVNDPSLINSEFDLNLISLNQVERIEILKGAQSTLYGSDAVAGVINIISTPVATKPLQARATLSAGSFGTVQGSAQVSGKVKKFNYQFSQSAIHSDGFSSAWDSSGKKDFDKDSYDGQNSRAGIGYQLTNDLSLQAFGQYSRYKTELDAAGFVDETDQWSRNINRMAGTGIKFQKGIVSLAANYQYSDIRRYYFNDSTDRPGFVVFSTDDYKGSTQFLEAYASIALSDRFRLLQGADHRFGKMQSSYSSISAFGPFKMDFNDTSFSQSSMYGSLSYRSVDGALNIELGGRLNVHSRYGGNHTFTFNPSYRIHPALRVFGSIASGFKAPSLYQLSPNNSKGLRPERSVNYELGVQHLHGKLQSRLVGFYREIADGIDFNNNSFKYFNFLEQKVKGLELELALQPAKGWNISGNYTLLSGTERTQDRLDFSDTTTYTYLLRRPEQQANLRVSYAAGNGLYVALGSRYTGRRRDFGGYMKADVVLDAYMLLDAYASYGYKKVTVFADAQNLTGKRFFDVYGYRGMPFRLQAGVQFRL